MNERHRVIFAHNYHTILTLHEELEESFDMLCIATFQYGRASGRT